MSIHEKFCRRIANATLLPCVLMSANVAAADIDPAKQERIRQFNAVVEQFCAGNQVRDMASSQLPLGFEKAPLLYSGQSSDSYTVEKLVGFGAAKVVHLGYEYLYVETPEAVKYTRRPYVPAEKFLAFGQSSTAVPNPLEPDKRKGSLYLKRTTLETSDGQLLFDYRSYAYEGTWYHYEENEYACERNGVKVGNVFVASRALGLVGQFFGRPAAELLTAQELVEAIPRRAPWRYVRNHKQLARLSSRMVSEAEAKHLQGLAAGKECAAPPKPIVEDGDFPFSRGKPPSAFKLDPAAENLKTNFAEGPLLLFCRGEYYVLGNVPMEWRPTTGTGEERYVLAVGMNIYKRDAKTPHSFVFLEIADIPAGWRHNRWRVVGIREGERGATFQLFDKDSRVLLRAEFDRPSRLPFERPPEFTTELSP